MSREISEDQTYFVPISGGFLKNMVGMSVTQADGTTITVDKAEVHDHPFVLSMEGFKTAALYISKAYQYPEVESAE